MLQVASFFSGIGGFDIACEQLGLKIVFQCEINPFCQKVLRAHWPEVPLYPDIKKLPDDALPSEAELWCAGFPCQDLSLANQGKRKGLKGERSGLFYQFAERVEKRKPRWLLIENVPGLLNSHDGDDFKQVIQRLDELGYGVSWRIFDAKYFGTPQRRRRVYLVASFGSLRSADVLFDTKPASIAPRAGLGEKDLLTARNGSSISTSNIYSIQHAGIGRKPSAGPQAKGYRNDGETYTLDSRGCSDAVCSPYDAFGVRKATRFPRKLDGNRYRAIGNAVCVHVVKWIVNRIIQIDSKSK